MSDVAVTPNAVAPNALTPHAIAAFRREDHIPAGYSPGWHLARTIAMAALIAAVAVRIAVRAGGLDWLFLPAFVVAANFIEWAFHRGPMHRVIGPPILYRNHTLIHHRAFLHSNMPMRDARDLGLVIMSWYTMLLLFALGSPIALFAWWLRGPGLAGIFYLTVVGYFLSYETLHALYHTSDAFQKRSLWLRGGPFQALLAHHRQHHHLDRMSHINFNVTFPLADALLGTKEREGAGPAPRRPRAPTPAPDPAAA